MSISTDQWHASIGLFYGQVYGHIRIKLSIGKCDLKVVIVMLCFFAAFAFLLLLKHGDVEINPGPNHYIYNHCGGECFESFLFFFV